MFKKINLLNKKITIPNGEFAKALNSNREFGITIEGKIDDGLQDEIYVFKGKPNLVHKKEPLGRGYRITSNFVSVSIDVSGNWDKVEELNRDRALYIDNASEGVDSFNDEVLEEIVWHSVEFGIGYRELVEKLEKDGEGILVCVESSGEPYIFNGIGFVKEEKREEMRELIRDFAVSQILQKIEKERENYQKYGFSDEELEAINYFKLEAYPSLAGLID